MMGMSYSQFLCSSQAIHNDAIASTDTLVFAIKRATYRSLSFSSAFTQYFSVKVNFHFHWQSASIYFLVWGSIFEHQSCDVHENTLVMYGN